MPRGFVAGEGCAFAVYERLRPHHDAGGAEAALERAVRGESCREPVAFGIGDAFQSHHIGVGYFLHRGLAGDTGFAVHQHGAATALACGRTAVFRRDDMQLFPQGCEKVRMVAMDCDLLAVQSEASGHGGFANLFCQWVLPVLSSSAFFQCFLTVLSSVLSRLPRFYFI